MKKLFTVYTFSDKEEQAFADVKQKRLSKLPKSSGKTSVSHSPF